MSCTAKLATDDFRFSNFDGNKPHAGEFARIGILSDAHGWERQVVNDVFGGDVDFNFFLIRKHEGASNKIIHTVGILRIEAYRIGATDEKAVGGPELVVRSGILKIPCKLLCPRLHFDVGIRELINPVSPEGKGKSQ